MLLQSVSDDTRLLARTRCKQWTCPHCAEINRKQWRARIIDHINNKPITIPYRNNVWTWFTLTAHSRMRGAERSIANLRNAWDTLSKRMHRKFGAFDYIRVFEKHKDGTYHIHGIASFHFGDIRVRKHRDGRETKYSAWLQKNARDLSLGRYTHADDISPDHHAGYVAAYVTKYLTKISPAMDKALGRVRHIQASQSWPALPRTTSGEWQATPGYYDIEFLNDIAVGIAAKDINTGEFITYDAFVENYVYPPEFGKISTYRGKSPQKPQK